MPKPPSNYEARSSWRLGSLNEWGIRNMHLQRTVHGPPEFYLHRKYDHRSRNWTRVFRMSSRENCKSAENETEYKPHNSPTNKRRVTTAVFVMRMNEWKKRGRRLRGTPLQLLYSLGFLLLWPPWCGPKYVVSNSAAAVANFDGGGNAGGRCTVRCQCALNNPRWWKFPQPYTTTLSFFLELFHCLSSTPTDAEQCSRKGCRKWAPFLNRHYHYFLCTTSLCKERNRCHDLTAR